MPLSPGTRLGRFAIQGPLGAGGMGEVYRAADPDLKREVAIKVLPEAVAADAGRITRFQREAEVLASLNHPNIAAIYGIERAEGRIALVLELVEGGTLADRIAQGPLPIDEATAIATQIADALDAAHARGIIHRDLKPSNVKVREDGAVKVLDFGLAKALAAADPAAGGVESTLTSPVVTGPAVILGTPAYMSPEQARGKGLDKRTDIWAFGCVVFEMLTRTRAFDGDSATDVLSAVVSREPVWDALPPDTPPAIRRLLRRCLEKDPARRLRDIGDARLELVEAGGPDETGGQRAAMDRSRAWVAFAAGLIVAAAIAGGVWWSTSPVSAPPSPAHRFSLVLSPPSNDTFTVSRDGSRIAYVGRDPASARDMLYVRALDEVESRLIPGTENARQPFFSPDGMWIGYLTSNFPAGGYAPPARLRKVAVSGGRPETLADAVALGASWGADGTIVFAGPIETRVGLFRVPAHGGTPTQITSPRPGEERHGWPQHVPGRDAILFSVTGQRTFDEGRIAMWSADTGDYRMVVSQGYGARLLPTGHLAYVAAGNLVVAPFDAARGEPSGPPVRVVSSIFTTPITGRASFSISDSGLLLYEDAGDARDLTPVWVTREGAPTPVLDEPDAYHYPRLSPDGRWLAIGIDRDERDVWLVDLQRSTRTRTTAGDRGVSAPPAITDWAPDGRLTFNRRVKIPETTLESIDAAREGTPLVLVRRPMLLAGPSWSPEGSILAFFAFAETTQRDLWVMDRRSGETTAFLATAANERAPRVSRDGRWIAYVSDSTGRDEVYIRPYPGPGAPVTVSVGGGAEPMWSKDGRELFYRLGDRLMAVSVETRPTLSLQQPRVLFERAFERELLGVANYDVAADGRFVMIAKPPSASAESTRGLVAIEHWFEELRRLSPVR